MKQYITLPNSNRVSLAAYARVWRQLKTMHPNQEVKGWTFHPERAAVILRAMRAGMHDRINTRGGISQVGVYLGNGFFTHASVGNGVTISSLDEKYYSKRFIGGGRLNCAMVTE